MIDPEETYSEHIEPQEAESIMPAADSTKKPIIFSFPKTESTTPAASKGRNVVKIHGKHGTREYPVVKKK